MYVTTMLGEPALPDPLLRLPRPLRRLAGRLVLHRRERDPDRGDGRHLRDDDGDRERAPVRHAPAAPRDAREPARDLHRPRPAVRRQRHPRLGLRLRDVVAAARLPAGGRQPPGARARDRRDDVLVRRARDADRLDRAPRAGRLLRREPRLLPDAARLRRQHRERRPPRLARGDRALPAAHPRDRGGAARSRPARRSATSPGCSGPRRCIGLAYATAAYVLFRVFEAEGRRRASLETF